MPAASLARLRLSGFKSFAEAATVEIRHPGRYRAELEFRVGGWQEFGGEYTLTASLGGHELTTATFGNGASFDTSATAALRLLAVGAATTVPVRVFTGA